MISMYEKLLKIYMSLYARQIMVTYPVNVMAIVLQVFSCPLSPGMTGTVLEMAIVVLWTGDCIDNTKSRHIT